MNVWIAIALIAFVVVLVVPMLVPCLMAFGLSRAAVHPLEPSSEYDVFKAAGGEIDESLALELGFKREGAYRVNVGVGVATFAMWRHGRDATYLAVYTVAQGAQATWNIDLVSVFAIGDPDVGLTTGTTRDGHVTGGGRDGEYMQTFSTRDLRDLWEHHTDAESFICVRHDIDPTGIDIDGGTILERSLHQSGRNLITRPWRCVLIPFRFWVGRFVWHDKTVRDRFG